MTRVHRNLNRACWSVSIAGGPVRHVDACTLSGVRFVVQVAGRARVLARGVRAVHAYAAGDLAGDLGGVDLTGAVEVTYNPFRSGSFTTRAGEAVSTAARVHFDTTGRAWAWDAK